MADSARRDDLMRYALWASALFNLGGALLFAFPDSLGRLAGFPGDVPRVYSAIGDLAFAIVFAWWLHGEGVRAEGAA